MINKNMEDIRVIILLSTYNGSRFLTEQIDSITNQDFKGKKVIFIRDDGSTDETINIIEKYKSEKFASTTIKLVQGNNIGPQRSFMKLINTAGDADYYFFADQDDVWLPDKISNAIYSMANDQTPSLYCTDYSLTDENLNIICEHSIKTTPKFKPLTALFFNSIPGCTIGMNKSMFHCLQELQLENVIMHDAVAVSLCSAVGKIHYSTKPSVLHRIHGKNVVGYGHKKINLLKWLPEKINKLRMGEDFSLPEMALRFLTVMAEQNNEQYKKDIELVRDYNKSIANTIRLMKHKDLKQPFLDRTNLSVKCHILFHLYG